ncbi:P2Y purinoceptor 8-like [Rhineura floridana]|uniref:P2Y purinoceptor 8-like n=1 Tax=Rhineura floridana TaxID=261503 RepID=UPI002AC863B6|nr:P2Y purinoceptor 8-like [Rhineura floridana]XP_061483000.1 P2Y purinoceptor 8-like [Rhineura floridana]XP_061483003.1 P2Y purinoceptor 8-like [Rhineura floridana]XP_061483004.1 P2Y purinoceptor 8-like [Rhineura floridana]XP_061483005.1 P2Y purinoceptor 8-like [Rhineura floridana]XP_061483006.1 P2Y purinoceptor 8-like [Rhineura floridana]XP_061483007.1 P2Y purinoceptor 8-like [Rhineura floridana]XP_061483008.1 P2Y purinoceptor 8-like [Rhineura floridana]
MDKNDTKLDSATLDMLKNQGIMITLPVVYSLIAIISIPGNIFSLWILFFHIKPRTTSVIFMINLSVTDLALVSCFPFQIIYHSHKNHWSFSKNLCSFVTVMFYANMYCSIITMTYISFDRYLGVVYPMTSKKWRRKRYAISSCFGMWCLVLLALWPLAATDLTYEVKELNITTCFDVLKWDMLPNKMAWAAFLLLPFFFFFLVPFTVTVACYIGIIRKLIQASHKYGNGQKTRSIYLAVIVLLVFIICFAPNNFILLVHMVSRLNGSEGYYHIYKLTLCLSCFNNCIDPFIYYFASKEFYQKFKQVIGQKVPLIDSWESRRESLFSARTMSARSMSSGHVEGMNSPKVCLQRHESVF